MAVDPSAKINSSINLGLAEGTPELYKTPQEQSLYQLVVQTANNILSQFERFVGVTQKPMAQWSLLTPSDTLFRQNLGRLYVIFSETVAFGGLVNLFNNSGILTARNANSTTLLKRAFGYCNVNNSAQSGAGVGQYGEVILSQGLLSVTGINPGDLMYLSSSDGQMQIGPDVTAGHLEQFIGVGIGIDLVYIDISLGRIFPH